MQKTILVTGSTDGIGLELAKTLVSRGNHVLIHGRSPAKLKEAENMLSGLADGGSVESYVADFSRMSDVEMLAKTVIEHHDKLDVLINNAGVYKTSTPITQDGLDVRFMVNTIAPYLLTQRLLPLVGESGRVINLSSAAQNPVDPAALAGRIRLSDEYEAYAQSKLAITMWSHSMALTHQRGPVFVAVNPGSLLATKMVKKGFGIPGKDINVGVDILIRAAFSYEFASASGRYFDNDSGQFSSPHPDAADSRKCENIVKVIESVLADLKS